MIAILLPSYRRLADLCGTIDNTTLTGGMKFIIVANYDNQDFIHLYRKYSNHEDIMIIDEKKYGQLGVAKAYNLAYQVANKSGFSHVILYADDTIPFDKDWGQRLEAEFISHDLPLGIFSTDECHPGYFGWNFIENSPIAHFFILKCGIVPTLFPEEYRQYYVDLDISVRMQRMGYPIGLLPIRINHLRSPSHREMNQINGEYDKQVFLKQFPEYHKDFTLRFIPDCGWVQVLAPGVDYETALCPK